VVVRSWRDTRTMPSELAHPRYTETAVFNDESLCGESSADSREPGIVLASTYIKQT